MSEDLSDNIDLCLVCIDKAPTKRGFTHAATHTVVKAEQTIHDFEFARIVDAGRRVVETTKEMLRSLEKLLPYPQVSGEGTSNSTDDEEGRPPHPQCLACEKRISAPCWACVECCEFRSLYTGREFVPTLVPFQPKTLSSVMTATSTIVLSQHQQYPSTDLPMPSYASATTPRHRGQRRLTTDSSRWNIASSRSSTNSPNRSRPSLHMSPQRCRSSRRR